MQPRTRVKRNFGSFGQDFQTVGSSECRQRKTGKGSAPEQRAASGSARQSLRAWPCVCQILASKTAPCEPASDIGPNVSLNRPGFAGDC